MTAASLAEVVEYSNRLSLVRPRNYVVATPTPICLADARDSIDDATDVYLELREQRFGRMLRDWLSLINADAQGVG